MIAERSPSSPGARSGGGGRARIRPVPAADPIVPFSHATTSMGGRLVIHLDAGPTQAAEADRASAAVIGRIECWAARLTRHSAASELTALNADPRDEVRVGPTLAATLRAGRTALEQSEGLADITLLDQRLAVEGLAVNQPAADGPVVEPARHVSRAFEWAMAPAPRGAAIVRRPPGLHFDLGGIGKGWIADRAMRLLAAWPSAVVDADGDLAIRCAPGKAWEVAVDDPRTPDTLLAVLRLAAHDGLPARWGVATSGVSIHRWTADGRPRHHLIDPRTGRKAAVIAGSAGGFALLERAGVRGAVVLTERGETLALPQTLPLLGG